MLDLNGDIFKGFLEIIYVFIGFLGGKLLAKIADVIKEKYMHLSVRRSQDIRLRLSEIRASFIADRAMILQFHNGKQFVGEGNLHSYYLSCNYESTSMGFSSEIENMQNIPVSIWSEVLTRMQKKIPQERTFYTIGEDTTDTDWTWEEIGMETFATRMNITKALVIQVASKKNSFCGVLFMGFERYEEEFAKLVYDRDRIGELQVHLEDLRKQL